VEALIMLGSLFIGICCAIIIMYWKPHGL